MRENFRQNDSSHIYLHSFAELKVVICNVLGVSSFTKGEKNVTMEKQRKQSVTKIFASKAR